jgi:hypothetical protein
MVRWDKQGRKPYKSRGDSKMKLSVKFTLFALASVAMAQPNLAQASSTNTLPSSAGNSSSSNAWWETASKSMRASYLFRLAGPSVQSLSGNATGGGTSLAITHFPTLGYRIGSKWSVSATQPFSQRIDEAPAAQADPFVANDPYVTFTNGNILSQARHGVSLSGYLRYIIPVSRATNQNSKLGRRPDAGNGAVQVYLGASRSELDGKVTVAVAALGRYRIPGLSSQERGALSGSSVREDYFLLLNPSVSYAFSPKYDVYIEYISGFLTHSTDSKWTKFNDPNVGQLVSVGTNAYLGRLSINPSLSAGPKFNQLKILKTTSIGLDVSYSFM